MEILLVHNADGTYSIIVKDHTATMINVNAGKDPASIARTVNAFAHYYRTKPINLPWIQETVNNLKKTANKP